MPTLTVRSAPEPSHVERIIAYTTGEVIRIGCRCAIGHDHTYDDWLSRFDRIDAGNG